MLMRRIIYIALLFIGLPLFAQTNIPTFQFVNSAPTGACTGTPPVQVLLPGYQMYGCVSGTWTIINGGGGTGALFPGTNGLVKNTSTTTAVTATGSRDGTGDYQLPIIIQGAGGGFSCSLAGFTWTCTLSGGGLTGAVNPGNANQATCYPAGSSPGSTTVGPCPRVYMLDPGMTGSQITSLLGGLSGQNTYVIPAGTPQELYTSNGQIPWDTRLGASWFQMPGVACDGKQSALTIQITAGSNTSNVGSLLSAADNGKTFYFTNVSGRTFGFTQSVWAAKLQGYAFPSATWSANAPFSENALVYYGTDNLSTINTAMTQASSIFPLTIPTGCKLLVNGTIAWNNSQVIVGRHLNAGGFIGVPGKDVIATTDTNGQSISSPGTGLKGFATVVGSEVDATFPIDYYAADGTKTTQAAMYRPAQPHTPNANHPCAPGWFVNCINSVGALVAGSTSMTVPAGVKLPAVGNVLVFPYLAKVFTTAADAVNTGSRVVTMHAVAPAGSTQSQAEFFAGTSVQTTTTSIPGTPTYPFTLQLTNPIKPIPGWVSNFAQYGHAKIQDYEFDYMGGNTLTSTIIVQRGPATVNGGSGYPGTNTIVALNPCPAKFDQPWPVTPSINAGDSTPSGSNWFPGQCVGAAAIAFPTANANVFVGSGLVDGFLEDLQFIPSTVQSTNSIAGVYIAGNNAPFGSTIDNLKGPGLQYGIVQGPASSGQHGVAAVGPTGFGNTITSLHFFDAFPLSFVDMQGSTVDGLNLNSTMINPYDGTAIGGATCLQEGLTLDEQTGNVVTSTSFNSHHVYGCEPENGSHLVNLNNVIIDSSHASFDTANFEGIPNTFAGDHLKVTNSVLHVPAIDYGANNDFGIVDGSNSGYITNVWDGTPQFLEWGKNSKCSMWAGGIGPEISCGASLPQGYQGRGIEPSLTGSKPYFQLGGMITPWMWDNNGMLDAAPMTTIGTPDTTASYWGASATCNLASGGFCRIANFNGFNGKVYIGPFNQFYDGPYLLDATFKSLSASSSFLLTISAFDGGLGTCSTPGTIFAGTVNTTTSFTAYKAAMDFTGRAGCTLQVQYSSGSTADSVAVDRFNLVPVPQQQLLRVATLTPGTACGAGVANGALLSSDSSGLYMCGNNVIQLLPFGGSLGINQITGDVVAGPCTGSCASTVTRIGGGTILSTFAGLLNDNFGVIGQAQNFSVAQFGQVGTYFRDGVNTVAFAATPVFNLALGDTQLITLTGDVTSSTFSNPPALNASQPVRMWVCQDGTGGHKFNYPTVIQGITPVTMLANQCTSLFVNVATTGAGTTYIADNFNTENCISSASPAVCDQSTIGEIAIPTGTNPTLQINTTAWQAHSQLLFAPDQTKAADLGITCNTALPAGRYEVTGGSAGVDVVITWIGTISTNALCGTYTIRNP
jgi:hypothetical protein